MIKEIILENFLDELLKNKENLKFIKKYEPFFSKFKTIKIKFGKNNLIYSEENKSGKTLAMDSLFYVLGLQFEKEKVPLISKINSTANKIMESDFENHGDIQNCFFTFSPTIKFTYKNIDYFLKREVKSIFENGKIQFKKDDNIFYIKKAEDEEWDKLSDHDWDKRQGTSFFIDMIFENWFELYGFKKFKYKEKEILNIAMNKHRSLTVSEYCSIFSIFQADRGSTADLFSPTMWNTHEANYSLFFSIFKKEINNKFIEVLETAEGYENHMNNLKEKRSDKRNFSKIIKLKKDFIFKNEDYKNFKKIEERINSDFEKVSKEYYFTNYEKMVNKSGKINDEYILGSNEILSLDVVLRERILEKNFDKLESLLNKSILKSNKNVTLEKSINYLFSDELKNEMKNIDNEIKEIEKKIEKETKSLLLLYEEIKKFGKEIYWIINNNIKPGWNGAEKREAEIKVLNILFEKYPHLKLPFLAIDPIDEAINDKYTYKNYMNELFKNRDKINQFFLVTSEENNFFEIMMKEINEIPNIIYINFQFLMNDNISFNKNNNIEYVKYDSNKLIY